MALLRPAAAGRRGTPSAADITAVRQRQRELGVPEAFEWVHETTPDLLAVARSAGLDVLLAPLMVLERAALVPDLPLPGATIRFLDPASPRLRAPTSASAAPSASSASARTRRRLHRAERLPGGRAGRPGRSATRCHR